MSSPVSLAHGMGVWMYLSAKLWDWDWKEQQQFIQMAQGST